MRPLVSVIIPNYNHASFLEQRIESVLQQTYENIEIILLDDCSTDLSLDILQRYEAHPKVKCLIVNKKNSGSTFRQWAKGLEYASGEYVWIAESDDVSKSHMLNRMVPLMDARPEIGLAYCQSHNIDSNGCIVGDYLHQHFSSNQIDFTQDFVVDGREFISFAMIKGNSIPNVSAVLFRRTAIDNTFNRISEFRYCGDWFSYIQILNNYFVGYCFEMLNHFRSHEITTRYKKSAQQYVSAIDEIFQIKVLLNHLGYITDKEKNDYIEHNKLMLSKYLLASNYVPQSNICIYGAGILGVSLLNSIGGHFVKCFIDRNSSNQRMIGQIPVYSIGSYSENESAGEPIIIASMAFYDEIYSTLKEYNLHKRVLF